MRDVPDPETAKALARESTLDDHRRAYTALRDRAEELAGSLSAAQALWQPDPKRWSIAHCLAHLNVTARLYLPRIEAAIDEGRERGVRGDGPYRHGRFAAWLINSIEPPPGLRVGAPKPFRPPPDPPWPGTLDDYLALKDRILTQLDTAEGLDLARLVIISPAFRLLRLRLAAALAYVAAHERRHLWQAERVRQDAGFPG